MITINANQGTNDVLLNEYLKLHNSEHCNGIYQVDNMHLSGRAYFYGFDNRLYIQIYDITVKQNTTVKSIPPGSIVNSYFFFNPESQEISSINTTTNPDIVCIKTNDEISIQIKPQNNYCLIYIGADIEWLKSVIAGYKTEIETLFDDEEFVITHMESPRLHSLKNKLMTLTSTSNVSPNGLCTAVSIEILTQLFHELYQSEFSTESMNLNPAIIEKMNQARKMLEENLNNSTSIDKLALEIGVSQTVLRKYFKQLFGYSPYNYQKVYKMEVSYNLISESKNTIKEIAYNMGYSCLSRFSSEFKKHHGISPSKVVKENY